MPAVSPIVRHGRCFGGIAVAFLALSGGARADDPADFIAVRPGTLPIIISAPHGGGLVPSDLSPRVCDEEGEVCLNDQNTQFMAVWVASELERLTGERPFEIINYIDRSHLDQNRSNAANPFGANESYEDPDGLPYYDYYHGAVSDAVAQVIDEYGAGLLIDLHGQSQYPDPVIRGTRNGQTVERLLARNGEGALIGPSSVFGRLEQLGYEVTPPNEPLAAEPEVLYNGGHIVSTYGSHRTNGIDALQIEFAREYRVSDSEPEIWRQSAIDLADAIQVFYEAYLAEPALPGDYNGDGRVDAADYTTWRDHLGQEIILPGDTSPGVVSASDYEHWRDNYGSEPDAVATPEPGCVALVASGMIVVWRGRPLGRGGFV